MLRNIFALCVFNYKFKEYIFRKTVIWTNGKDKIMGGYLNFHVKILWFLDLREAV